MKPTTALIIAALFVSCFSIESGQSATPEEKMSAHPLNALKVEKSGVKLIVALPETNLAGSIPMDVILINRSDADYFYDATGYLFDCRLVLRTADGKAVPFSRLGGNLFEDGGGGGGQFAQNVKLERGQIRNWEFDTSQAFEPLPPGKYQLSLRTKVYQGKGKERQAKIVTLEATDIPFQIE